MSSIKDIFSKGEKVYDEFQTIPQGIYNLEILEADARQSKSNPDNWYVNVQYNVTAGPLGDEDYDGDEYNGRRIFGALFLNEYTSDGKPARSISETFTHLSMMLGDDLPDAVIDNETPEEFANAIANVLPGNVYDGARVGVQKATDDFPAKNVVRLPKRDS